MRTIKGIELVESALGRWNPSDLVRIVDFQYVFDQITLAWNVNITAEFQKRNPNGPWPLLNTKAFVVKICFMKVDDLHVDIRRVNFDFQVVGFDITDISDRGMEDLNFFIEDYEDNVIQFYCKDITIESVDEGILRMNNGYISTSPLNPNNAAG